MRAIVVEGYGEPEVMRLVECEIPEPEADEVLVQVEAIGVNPVDTYVRAGAYPVLPPPPYTPGKDVSGRVVEVGDGVKKWKKGDRVYSAGTRSGAYAEYAVCHHSQIFSLPENLDFFQGAAVGIPGAAAWRALLKRARARKGERLLIHGASGSVGMIAIQLAVARGLTVYGTAGSDKGMDNIKKAGVLKAYNHSSVSYIEDIQSDCGDRGVDIILEMLANVNLAHDLQLLGVGGRVVIIGSRGTINIDPRATMAKETEILGMSLFNGSEVEMKEAQVGLYQLMSEGRLVPEISVKMELDQAPQAHRMILENGNCGKILLVP